MKKWPWAGFFGGAAAWYLAHDLGFYFSDFNCRHPGILPLVHVVMFFVCVAAGRWSYAALQRSEPDGAIALTEPSSMGALISVAASVLFALVIVWQGIASFIFSGCER